MTENTSIVTDKREATNIEPSSDARLEVLKKDGKLLLTDDQKSAVLAKGKVLVSAAAGSGKTSTMVQRIMLMVAEGIPMRDMLILVYNTSAADELRERLHHELFDRACSSRGEMRERYRGELDELPFCRICTIHAFCNNFIRENFEKTGLSPTFEVLDEQAHNAYKNAALDSVFDEYSKDGDEQFGDIVEMFSQARKEENLRANIIKLHSLIEIQPDRNDFEKKVEACFSDFGNSEFMSVLKAYYCGFFSEAERRLGEISERLCDTSLEKYKSAVAVAAVLCKEITAAETFREMCALACGYEKPDLGKRVKIQDFEKRVSDEAKVYLDEVREAAEELAQVAEDFCKFEQYHKQNAVYVRKIIELTRRFDEELKKAKRQDNVLSFEDLQKCTVDLLKEYPQLGNAYGAVFVDEYQDVNPTQEFIISSLVKGECFMVGDVKQSIYGFRLADPTIFLSRLETYKNGGGTAIDFNRNFRSARAILHFVNSVFNVVMTQESADVDYKNTSAFELDGTPADGYVRVHIFTDKKSEKKTAGGLYDITAHDGGDDGISASRYEGRFIANEIKTLVGHAVVGDRKMEYGDIAVLFRSRSKGASLIVEQLKSAGIPVDEGVFGKSDTRPERELVCMLQTIDNPRQDIPLAGYLLSFFGGYSEAELAVIAARDGDCLYDKVLECAEEGGALAEKIRRTLVELDGYRIKASFKSTADLMSGILSDYCYDAYIAKSGETDVFGLKAFIACAAARDGISLGKFLQDYGDGAESKAVSGGGNRVRVSTFHSFKGLEIPVVFVADAAYGFNYDSGDMTAFGKGYIGLKYFDFQNKFKYGTLSRLAVAKLGKVQCIKEEMRLFYVALTRAKQLMYVTASVSAKKSAEFGTVRRIGGASCDLDFISAAVCDGSADVPVIKHGAEDFEETVADKSRRVLPSEPRMVEAIMRGREHVYQYGEATSLAMKYSVSSIDGQDDAAIRVYEEAANEGTAYHKVMQFIDLFAEGRQAVECELSRMVGENILTEEERACVDAEVIEKCMSSEVIKLAREAALAGKCLRERSFMMYKPANEVHEKFTSSDKVLVQGVVDLFIDGGKKVLVDFKYSRLDDAKLAEKYKNQLYLYKTAIESAITAEIDRTVVYSFRSGSVIDVAFDRV